jgi:hypothetical protein
MQKLTFEEVKQVFIDKGYELLETEYKNSKTKMKYRCSFHPEKDISISLTHLKEGKGCPYCANRGVVTIEDARQLFVEHGYELITDSCNFYRKL